MPDPRASHIPVAILTGFLGSGKTTLLNSLLRDPRLADTAVVVNELGEIGLDHLLVVGGDDNVVLLNAGCLCCSMLNGFKETLADLSYKRARSEVPAFRRVVVETTGLADPAPLLQALLRDSFLMAHYTLAGITSTVDALLGEVELTAHPESVKQAALADVLVLTKTDLSGGEPAALVRRLRELNPEAPLLTTTAVGPDTLFPPLPAMRAAHSSAFAPAHAHAHDIRADSFIISGAVTWAGLAGWSDFVREVFGTRLLRCKGLLEVQGQVGPVLIQGVQTVFGPPLKLGDWPDSDRRSRLVCITQGVALADLRDSLKILHAEPGTYRPASLHDLRAAG